MYWNYSLNSEATNESGFTAIPAGSRADFFCCGHKWASFGSSTEFDNDNFWEVMREWSKNNKVFISETHAPDDFISIWEKQSHRSMSQSSKTRYKSESEMYKTENLFIHENNLKDLII